MVVGFPLPIDDLPDEDDDIQSIMGVSTMPHQWDYSSFMVYRTTYEEITRLKFGSYFVYSYAKSIFKYFGPRSSVSLSRCGQAPYDSIEELVMDSLIVKNIGLEEVIWWCFSLFDEAFGVEGLVKLLERCENSDPVSFYYNPITAYSRLLLTFVDKIEIF